ncbi:CocE/NonD family hydrolase [Geopsychrobacter electrodiphilus]|uniref:CocE/NonD family hydrolase n=1 Tax=Geopsychrobacter electrodiphilus TaxID=225196 RepID=UPI0003628925|nr:CocE/NonD family hydrolase [Geopsychrobacter electrodiphilus]
MQYIDSFPCQVKTIENLWIPMADGVRLAGRLWLPQGAEQNPVPAILEYIPYRKRDFTRLRDTGLHHYQAGHGYAALRVDLRGSGDSEGLLQGEYLEQELADGEQILRWLAEQPWCNGKVGIIGISWGGFNGLQLAARQPPELKAVVSVASTDDRYADDVHYMGGCLLGDNLSWAGVMFAYNSMPPDPQIVGDAWRDMWFERLKQTDLWLDTWMRHQQRDAYWQHGSICEDFSALKTPVMTVSGWADGYTNAVFRMLEHLDCPRLGLVGPWSHRYPHDGIPGPAIGFLQEVVRWWDYWLKDQPNGIMDEPMLRAYMLDSVPPTTSYKTRPGRWVTESSWPSPNIQSKSFTLGWRGIVPGFGHAPEVIETIRSPLSVGLFAGKWCSYSAAPDLPHDQRQEDGGALTFDSEVLLETMEILGQPLVELVLSADQPVAMVAVRLSDIAADDKATRVTYGMLNLTHRDSHEQPAPLEVGRQYRVQIKLNNIAQTFPAGHRFRISVSTSYWPLAWSPPRPVCLAVLTGASRVILPVRVANPTAEKLCTFDEPQAAQQPRTEQLGLTERNWRVIRDLENDVSTLEVFKDEGVVCIKEIDLEMEKCVREWYSFQGDDFDSVRGEVLSERGVRRGDWYVKTVTRTVLQSDAENFYLRADLDAYEAGFRVYCQSWDRTIPRRNL